MAVTVSHYYILVIPKLIDFMLLFRHSVWFADLNVLFCRVWNMQLFNRFTSNKFDTFSCYFILAS